MQQGLFVINKDLEVLMINEYAKNVLNVNNNLESRHISDIFTDNLIIENIKQSLDNKLELIFDVWDDAMIRCGRMTSLFRYEMGY